MLLRRLTKHLRAQNWLAVALDFIIVVFGILLAFQITEWNEHRVRLGEEARLIEQLRLEVSAQIKDEQAAVDFLAERLANLRAALLIVQETQRSLELSKDQCEAMARSHRFRESALGLPTLDEMAATGMLSRISNPDLRSALVALRAEREQDFQRARFIASIRANVVDDFGDEISLTIVENPDAPYSLGATQATCQLERIRANPTFRNRLIGNMARADFLVSLAKRDVDRLEKFAALLENNSGR